MELVPEAKEAFMALNPPPNMVQVSTDYTDPRTTGAPIIPQINMSQKPRVEVKNVTDRRPASPIIQPMNQQRENIDFKAAMAEKCMDKMLQLIVEGVLPASVLADFISNLK